MDASSYGRLVERGGYATGGVVQSTGFTLFGDGTPETRFPLPGLVSRSDTSVTLVTNPEASNQLGAMLQRAIQAGEIRLFPPDDGSAGVPAKVQRHG